VMVMSVQDADAGAFLQGLAQSGSPNRRSCEPEIRKETGRGKSRLAIRDLRAVGRCSQAVLNFLPTTDVGRLFPAPAEGDAQRDASEWERRERRERREREEERRVEAEERGAKGKEQPLFLTTPSLHSVGGTGVGCGGGSSFSFVLSRVSPLCSPWCASYLLRTVLAWAAGNRRLTIRCQIPNRKEGVKPAKLSAEGQVLGLRNSAIGVILFIESSRSIY